MIHQCALKLTEVCCQRNWIKEGDRSWCVYAMETRIGTTVFAVLLIVWSAVSTCWLETIAFVLPCYLLRQRMGGWHARTSFQCLIISISAVIVTCKLLGKAVMQLPTLVVIIINVTYGTVIRQGNTTYNRDVYVAQIALNKINYLYSGAGCSVGSADGIFGSGTYTGVVAFQKYWNHKWGYSSYYAIDTDGIIENCTWACISATST